MKFDNKVVAKRLKFLRVMAVQTQAETAKSLNISRSCLANYETERRIPDEDILTLFAKHFGVRMSYLTGISSGDVYHGEEELFELIPENGILDLSRISPEGRIALLQFYSFLKEK